jgi:phage shock protein PspC (stress-responsive transcriptional regulator)
MFLGVCDSLEKETGISSFFFRLIFIFILFNSFAWAIAIYLIMAAIIQK